MSTRQREREVGGVAGRGGGGAALPRVGGARWAALAGLAVGAGVLGQQWWAMRAVTSPPAVVDEGAGAARGGAGRGGAGAGVEDDDEAGPAIASVARTVRAMELIAVRLETTVRVRTRDESWRGNVDAEIRVPVSLFYGTDLAGARVESLDAGPLLRGYIVTVPPPRRLATEVYPEEEEQRVSTGWLRLRSVSGEYYLGLARKSLASEARRMVLTPEDQEAVREATRARVGELVRAIAGARARVSVRFDESLAARGGEVMPPGGADTAADAAADAGPGGAKLGGAGSETLGGAGR